MGIKSHRLKFSLGRFMIARRTTSFIPGAFIFLKLLVAQFSYFELLPSWFILIWLYNLKGIIFILIALLDIHISLSPL